MGKNEHFQDVTDSNLTDDRQTVMKTMSSYRSTPIRWLQEGRIAMGKLTLIAGDPGLGKSFITLDMAARVSRGELPKPPKPPEASPLTLGGEVVLLNAEDDAGDTIRPRLEAMDADLSQIHLFEGVVNPMGKCVNLTQLDTDVQLLAHRLKNIENLRLIIIDPISAYMGKTDSHNNSDVRAVLAQLARLASWTGAAVVCVTHLNKDTGGKRAIYRAMGSLAFTAAARAVHLVTKHPDDPSKRVVAPVKNNLGTEVSARVYRIEEGRVEWLDEDIEWDADSIEAASDGERTAPSAMEEAKRFLEESLKDGPELATKLREDAEGNGISYRTVLRAKKALAIESYKRETGWYWMIRRSDADEPRDSMRVHPEPDVLVNEQDRASEEELRELARLHGYEDNGFV